ncbi:MAG: lysine biosynthesis protein LysW [bacterium]
MNNVKTVGRKFNCLECKNECDLNAKVFQVGDIYECPTCGIEYEIMNVDSCGELEMSIIEEEK